ncbi:hypothetical protein O3M35_011518 [Rhynocoris fuscipes]|uniref:C2H2-type domain-containing protein n=1 Tax=Rhynocoris fuscipes TaxID=488301 RepID=A0AAW1CWI8_9HEMI
MFWILKKSGLTSGAVSFFNSINNNGLSSGTTGGGYNKLCCNDEKEIKFNDNEKKIPSYDFITNLVDIESDSSSSSELDVEDEISQDSDYEENLTCNVCDRLFCSQNQLSQHQQKKRHFGCSSCDSLFSSLMALEHHKEEFEHWSGDELPVDLSEESDHELSCLELERLL